MSAIDASTLLRPGLLEQASIVLARAAPAAADSVGADLGAAFTGLGARVRSCELFAELVAEGQQDATEQAAANAASEALADAGVIELLAVDAASVFARAYGDSRRGLSAKASVTVSGRATRSPRVWTRVGTSAA